MLSKPPAPKPRFGRERFATWWLGQQANLSPDVWCWKTTLKRGTLFAIVVLLLTAAHGYRYYNEPQLTVASIAPKTEFAPENRNIIDELATESRRERLRREAVQALQVDESLNLAMRGALDALWADIDRVVPTVPAFPF
ncbi:MAG: hypothetical protein AAFX40_15415, partial [Cyanobacteria bacterium J06639_1]